MLKRWAVVIALLVLAFGFWKSADFKTIAAGVAIFLFGMLFLEDGFTAFTGGVLEKFLKMSTDKVWKSMTFGVISTTIMQSSSLVSVITISFLSAGLIELAAGVGIIFGANIGTTTGAWLMAGFGMKVKISAYAMPMIVFGLILVFQKKKEMKGIGYILAGLGFLFLGIHFMKEGFETFKDTIDLAKFAMEGYLGLLVFSLIGVFATVIMQSSHATLMLIIAALASGQINYNNALALAIGANIGTTITAILGSISSNISGRRLAAAHLIFNTVTAVIAIGLIDVFRLAVDEISTWVGIAADDWTLKLAVFHTVFNTVGVLVMLPLIPRLVKFLNTRIKDTRTADVKEIEPLYLNEAAIQLPDTAMEVMYKETRYLFENAIEIIAHGINVHRTDIRSEVSLEVILGRSSKPFEIDVLDDYYKKIKNLYNEIIQFATQSQINMTKEQLTEIYNIRHSCRNIAEIVKDVAIMRDNIDTYTNSDNEHIKHEYNLLRKYIAEVLRTIFLIENEDEDMVLVEISGLKDDKEEHDVSANGTIDRLIRNDLVTIKMGTSLMNDNGITLNICQKLIEIAERIYVPKGSDLKVLEEEVVHPTHEI